MNTEVVFFLNESVEVGDIRVYRRGRDLQYALAADGWRRYTHEPNVWIKAGGRIAVRGDDVLSNISLKAFFQMTAREMVDFVDASDWGKAMLAELALMDSLED